MSQRSCGMSLVELMLALLLGALVVATAIGIFLSTRQTLATAQAIGRIQHNLQVALELLSRDVRQAGGNPCSRHLPLANLLAAPASRWWTDVASTQHPDGTWSTPWRTTVRGLTGGQFSAGTSIGARVAGSDALELLMTDSRALTVVSHDGARFILNTGAHGFSSGHLLLACDLRQASLFQATVSGAGITHPATGLNASGQHGLADAGSAEPFAYAPHALLARWEPVRWYLGHNDRNGTSLYRIRITLNGNTPGTMRQEMVEDISALEFRYWLAGASAEVPLSGVGGRWDEVTAVRITITASAAGMASEQDIPLQRTAVYTVHLRNRSP